MRGATRLKPKHVKSCKWCGGSIVFTKTAFGGVMAVDAEPVPRGTISLRPTGSRMQPYRAIEHTDGMEAGPLHRAHDCGGDDAAA